MNVTYSLHTRNSTNIHVTYAMPSCAVLRSWIYITNSTRIVASRLPAKSAAKILHVPIIWNDIRSIRRARQMSAIRWAVRSAIKCFTVWIICACIWNSIWAQMWPRNRSICARYARTVSTVCRRWSKFAVRFYIFINIFLFATFSIHIRTHTGERKFYLK